MFRRIELAVAILFVTSAANADLPRKPSTTEDASVAAAHAQFVRAADLVKQGQWADALAAFEQASRLRTHAVTTYNIGVCQRAMGQYVRARKTFLKALVENDASRGTELSPVLAQDTHDLITDIDRLLATVTVTLDPPTASVTFDGRPLEVESTDGVPLLAAGQLGPGAGSKPPAPTFRVRVDPGAHVITFSRKGYSDAIYNKMFAPGSSSQMDVRLDTLPATLHIGSRPSSAVILLNDTDVGLTPLDVIRPAGTYRVVVKKSGFVTYDTNVTARAGEELALNPSLPEEKKSIFGRWWFWTGVGVIFVGAIVGTAFAVNALQPATRPPLNGGSLGWTAPLR